MIKKIFLCGRAARSGVPQLICYIHTDWSTSLNAVYNLPVARLVETDQGNLAYFGQKVKKAVPK